MQAEHVSLKTNLISTQFTCQYNQEVLKLSNCLKVFSDLILADALGAYPKYHPIHSAVRSANSKMLHTILTMKPASLNMKDIKGLTPLHHAVMYTNNYIQYWRYSNALDVIIATWYPCKWDWYIRQHSTASCFHWIEYLDL